MTTRAILVANIYPSPNNPRFSAGDLSELAASIEQEGLLQNPRVREAFDELGPDRYYIEAGWRRWSAARVKGLEVIECSIAAPLRPDETALERDLVVGVSENGHRLKLHALEMTQAFVRLRDECGLTQEQIARRTGYHVSTVSNHLALNLLTPAMQSKMREGKLSKQDALKAVKTFRAGQRKKSGQSQPGAQWDPDHFSWNHQLAKKANRLCQGLGHNQRRLIGNVACGACWEAVIVRVTEEQMKVFFDEQIELLKKQWMHDYGVEESTDATVTPIHFKHGG